MRPRQTAGERETILDDRLLHMTREEAKAYLDEYMLGRGLAGDRTTDRAGTDEEIRTHS